METAGNTSQTSSMRKDATDHEKADSLQTKSVFVGTQSLFAQEATPPFIYLIPRQRPVREVMCLHYSYRGWIYPYLLRCFAVELGSENRGV